MIAKNHHSALKHSKFVEDSIGDLVRSRCVRESISCPIVCSPLLVVENTKGKLRLVTDLRYVNQFLNQYKFKYEGLDLISSLFRKGDFVSLLTSNLATTTLIFMRSRSLISVFPGVMGITKTFIFFVCSLLVYQLLAMCLPNF